MIEQSGTGSCVFEKKKVSVNIACKHKGAVTEDDRADEPHALLSLSVRARVCSTCVFHVCSTRIGYVSELSKGYC
jgi:hypothetical protein